MIESRPFISCDYILIDDEKYLYLNDDDPIKAYEEANLYGKSISFVAQPLYLKKEVITIPLMMTDEWLIYDKYKGLLYELRSLNKKHYYNFVGQCNYAGRELFKNLVGELIDYDFEATTPIWDIEPIKKTSKLINFLYRIAQAKFVFAPRGVGSSSFRAFQAMSVGSVPIITDMKGYAFDKEVDWDNICLRGSLSNMHNLIHKANNMTQEEYQAMSNNAMAFWDKYCRHDMLYQKIYQMIKGVR